MDRLNRAALVRQVSNRLGRDQLVWFGTRGDDVEAATELPQLVASFSIINAYRARSSVASSALEEITRERVDLDIYDIDAGPRADTMIEFRRAVLRTLARPSAVFTYRPSTFLSGVCFARRDRCLYLGLFKDHQAAFEHKPWVETAVAKLGIPTIPWTYLADDDQLDTLRFLHAGPVMLRRSRTNGGVGLSRLDDAEQLTSLWPDEDEAYVSVAPYIEGGLPLNVGAIVWHDGVTLHPASVQLIGVPSCTNRPFGYCGNDFGAIADLDHELLLTIGQEVTRIGEWLGQFGFLGAFGVDFLVKDGTALFTEVNPRFQGSTHASCQLSVENAESCLLLEHLGAHLGMDSPKSLTLSDYAHWGSLAHFVIHAVGDEGTELNPSSLATDLLDVPASSRVDVLTSPRLRTNPGATIARVTVRDRLTRTGFELADPWDGIVTAWRSSRGNHNGLANTNPAVSPRR